MTSSFHDASLAGNFWRGKRVLLTGHTGFKGSWLALWLFELGAQVSGLALPPETSPSLFSQLNLEEKIDHHVADIRDFDSLKKVIHDIQPEFVFHLAAQPLVRRSYQEPVATWSTNVMGTVYLMEALRGLDQLCVAVLVTTDKVYQNNEWVYGYRENDALGGHDPYSSSKAATEVAIASWRSSFCGLQRYQKPYLRIASARAGNVIGGGDWALDRILPDAMRALSQGHSISIRNSKATRPWQHVLEPLSGYLRLAEKLSASHELAEAFNFGPALDSNRTVEDLVLELLKHWNGSWHNSGGQQDAPHEANLLNLVVDKAHHQLDWRPRWDFSMTVERTVRWYKRLHQGEASAYECCHDDLTAYLNAT